MTTQAPMTTDELIKKLALEGGAIVSSANCTEMEIADAAATNRFAVDANGLGYVLRTKQWLDRATDVINVISAQ